MFDLKLTYPTEDGTVTIDIDGERTSFGRGSDADHRLADEGLSRLNCTIYREGGRVWIVDENSTNGTFVNGERTPPSGTPLKNGDRIKIGNRTTLTVHISDVRETGPAKPAQPAPPPAAAAVPEKAAAFSYLPVIVIAGAIFVISISAVFIVFGVLGSGGTEVAGNQIIEPDDPDIPRPTPRPKTENTPGTNTASTDNSNVSDLPLNSNNVPIKDVPPGKKYQDMSDGERRQYLEVRAMRIAQVIGNNSSEQIPAAAIDKIKGFADAYASRSKVRALGGCRFGDNLQVTYERASKNAPFIVRAFNEKGIDPRVGLYLAMIESEHCVCLQSPTGPLGMFQFTKATAELHGLKVFSGASPSNPDERCQPEPAARAAASYMKALTGRYGTGPASVPLAIGSYNSGEGGLSSNLQKALDSNTGLPRDFWTLIANGDKLSQQFQSENFKYVPKFFAAAIIGENPQDFGLNLQPISTYSK